MARGIIVNVHFIGFSVVAVVIRLQLERNYFQTGKTVNDKQQKKI